MSIKVLKVCALSLLVFPILFTSALPISHTKIHVKCGVEVVSHAKVHFFEHKNGHIRLVESLLTDEYGHLHLHKILKDEVSDIRITINDQCGMNIKETECNLPYYQFEIPLASVFGSDELFQRSPILNLMHQKEGRSAHCI